MRRTKLYCDQCGVPVAEVVGNTVVICSRHHGEKHTTVIPISVILVAMNGNLTVDIGSANTVE